jgi:activator of HSP90 ATPase
MRVLKQEYKIKAAIVDVWKALIDPKVIDQWGGGPAKMKEENGFEFSLWGGDIYGKNTKVVRMRELEQDWYGGKWDQPSKLKFELKEEEGITTVILTQTNIPENEFDDIADGWKTYYLGEIKKLLEK